MGFITTSCIVLVMTSSPQLERDFGAANDQLLAGAPADAARLYRSILNRSPNVPDIYFNLGHAEFQAGRPVRALIAYEQLLRLEPTDAEAAHNLRAIRSVLRPKDAPSEDALISDMLEALLRPADRWTVALLFLIGNALLFLGLALRRIGPASFARSGAVLASIGLASVFFFGGITAVQARLSMEVLAVAISEAPLRGGPDARMPSLGRLYSGARVRVLSDRGAWQEVESSGGESGWVEARHIAKVTIP